VRVALISMLLCLVGCASKQANAPPVLYSVVSNEASSNVWVVDAIDHVAKKRIRYFLVCDFYQWGNHEAVKDPTACDLSVGEEIAPNPLQTRPGDFLDVWARQDTLSITKGTGSEQVVEQFIIRSAKVLPYTTGT
jgi:hypothetical protein